MAAIAIILVGLVGIGLLVWSFLPQDLLGGGGDDGQGESADSQGGQESGGGVDAAFVHRATADNVAANNTYLDNALINDNPEAILYVTQNWNPDGGEGVYNDHPIGVWYDADRGRWAIFNQDRDAMTEGAAFNVAAMAEPAE